MITAHLPAAAPTALNIPAQGNALGTNPPERTPYRPATPRHSGVPTGEVDSADAAEVYALDGSAALAGDKPTQRAAHTANTRKLSIPLPAGLRFDGTMEFEDILIWLFTDLLPGSPSHGATIALHDHELSESALLTHLATTRAAFAR